MIRRRNLSHICLIIILGFSAFEVPIASGNDEQSLHDTGSTIQENVNQDEIISNNERSKKGLKKEIVAAQSQQVPRLRQSSSFKCSFMEGCTSIDAVSPIIKKNSIKKLERDRNSFKSVSNEKMKMKRKSRTISAMGPKSQSSKRWFKLNKYVTAKGFFKSQLEKAKIFDKSDEIEALSNNIAEGLVTEVENEEKFSKSKDTRMMKLLTSAKDLQEGIWEMIQKPGMRLAENVKKIREKGRMAVQSYCDCEGINLKEVKAKDVGGYKMYKYAKVILELGKLVLQMQSKDEYAKSLLPFMKAFFFVEEEKEDEIDALAKSLRKSQAFSIRTKRDGGLAFFYFPLAICIVGCVVGLAILTGKGCKP